MAELEIIALLRLSIIPHIGNISAKKLIALCGSPSAVFTVKKETLLNLYGIGLHSISELHNKEYLKAAEREWHYIERNSIAVYSYLSPDYPYFLKHCADGPILLFARGNPNWNDFKIISVVGTRQCTARGKDFCREFIRELLPYNPIIVSGMAYGIDIAIQKAANEEGLQTIGCLAHGLDRMYPASHLHHALKIEANGAMITEFRQRTIPERENFLQRNRIIAGISEATVVVESGLKGGSLVTAEMASGYHRDVFAVPGRPGDLQSVGCNNLIKSHKAQLITCGTDLVTGLNWDVQDTIKPKGQTSLFPDLEEDENQVFSLLREHGQCTIDQLVIRCNLTVNGVASTLLTLEMKGLIRPLPGKLFEIL